ncbi:hypothetical protein ACS0TY_024730 [Phlomoides rotata]
MATGIREVDCFKWQIDYKTYSVTFFNKSIFTTVTSNPARVSDWISEIKQFSFGRRLLVGLDVEWRPNSFRGQQNPVALLQLCVGDRCLIYQIWHSPEIPQSLAYFLSDDSNTFVGKGIKSDLDKLGADYGIGGNALYVDLGNLAADLYYMDHSLKNVGLKRLVSDVLGMEMEKPEDVTRSPWDNWCLTADQVQYACIDAFVSSEIATALLPYPYYHYH